MRKLRLEFLGIPLLILLCSCDGPSPSATPVAAVDASEVTAENLLASERYWPYRVALIEPVTVAGRDQALQAKRVGVLIRVEDSGMPRVDFGSLGIFEVPVRSTDLLARANAIREGWDAKAEPNFVHAIRARMLDSASELVQAFRSEKVNGRPGFLCVFADPTTAVFEELARSLAPLDDRHRVMTILFPQGEHADAKVYERLRSLDWQIPFVFDFLSEPYTGTLLREGTAMPQLLLQTAEGRIVLQGTWSSDTSQLVAALDAAFGEGLVVGAADEPGETR